MVDWTARPVRYENKRFRPFYRQFAAVPWRDVRRELLPPALPAILYGEDAEVLLGYGYVHPTEGPSLQFLASGKTYGRIFTFSETVREWSFSLPIRKISGVGCIPIPDEDGVLAQAYGAGLELLQPCFADEKLEEFRRKQALDPMRHEFYFDAFQVLFQKSGLEDEYVWVRGEVVQIDPGGGETWKCTILVEPQQDFDLHAGDTIHVLPWWSMRDGLCLYCCELDFAEY